MKRFLIWSATAVALAFPFTLGAAYDDACNYSPPEPGSKIQDLAENIDQLFADSTCPPIELRFRRRNDQAFLAVVRIGEPVPAGCRGKTGIDVKIKSRRGVVSNVQEHGQGIYSALVTPDNKKTGEYRVTASADVNGETLKTRHTALVLHRVRKHWGQPQMVEGLVNTRGWEDSAYITPDGEYLFIMYLPISPSCLLENKKDLPACHKTEGKVTQKKRPQFSTRFARNRVEDSGEIKNHCLAVDPVYSMEMFDKYNVYVPPMITYGFKRQSDGSFADPFPITVDHVSACVSPSGLMAHPVGDGKAIALMGLTDPSAWNTARNADYPSLFTAKIELDKPNLLAEWNPEAKSLAHTESNLQVLFGTPLPHRQDNPYAYVNPDTQQIEAVFWDSEKYDEDIFYRLLEPDGVFPEGPWGPVRKTPVFSNPKQSEIQPYFDGKVLTVTKRYKIVSRKFLGKQLADIADIDAWGKPRTELATCNKLDGSETGVVHALGDANWAKRDNRDVLYFVYLTRRKNELLDMSIGFVEQAR